MTLGEELWAVIEKAQGYAYISDAVEEMTDGEVLKVAEGALVNARLVVALLGMFLEMHGRSVIITDRQIIQEVASRREIEPLKEYLKNLATNTVSRDSGDYPMERGVRKL